MGKLQKNESGFSALEAILIIVIVGLIGFTGWYVYNSQQKANKNLTAASSGNPTFKKATKEDSTIPAAQTVPFVNVIQGDSTVIQVTPDKIAKTKDQADILTALHNSCKGTSKYVTVNHAVFIDAGNFVEDGKYAAINASTCDDIAKTLDDVGGSGAMHYLHKNSSNTWILDVSGQMAPNCSDVDGLGYPASVLSSCYDGDTPRAPKN